MVRQLTAIMFTDMAGYTALMQQDEHGARVSRDRQRAVLEDSIGQHGGRVLQYYGDGTLSVFTSAIEAVRCAIEIQEILRRDPPVPLRIGVHTGDVVHDAQGVFGDGVNVASRVQSLSVPGGILISGKVFDEVKNHGGIQTRELGSFNLKHVKHPTRVFAVSNDGLAIPSDADLAPQRARRERSVAVLPFVNMSRDPENEFFSDGITEEIINALTRVNGLKVTARTSSFAFKNHNEDVREIAEQLGVTHILEGSVRRAGSRARVTAQLICAKDGYHLFSQSYDRSIEDMFEVQDEIARTIVGELADHLGPVRVSEKARALSQGHSHDSEAHTEYMKGRFELGRFTSEGVRRSIEYFNRSIEMDPQCALPHAGLATAHVFLGAIGAVPPQEAFERAEKAAERALELEPDIGESHLALASVKLFHEWDIEGAYRAFQKALSLIPGSAETHHLYSMYLRVTGEFEESVDEARVAVQLDPLSLPYRNNLAQVLGLSGRVDEALEEAVQVVRKDPRFRPAVETVGWCHVLEGDFEAAARHFGRLPELANNEFAGAGPRGYAYAKLGRLQDVERMRSLLDMRTEAQPGVSLHADYALIHEGLGERDQAIARLSKAVDERMGSMIFVHAFVAWRDAVSDPRFQALMERIGIPQVAAV
jgi:TolB-like protein/class 3 adenylate cyclase/Flp pilus assembly protein TadD